MGAPARELVVHMTAEELRDLVRDAVRAELAALVPDVMTVEQAAVHVGRAEGTIRDWITQGLPTSRQGRRVHIRREDLAAWMARGVPTTDAIVARLRRPG